MGDLKILALEARNHLYAVFKDTEVWQEALQSRYQPLRQYHLAEFSQAGRSLGWRKNLDEQAEIKPLWRKKVLEVSPVFNYKMLMNHDFRGEHHGKEVATR